jgi:hypothetical protein
MLLRIKYRILDQFKMTNKMNNDDKIKSERKVKKEAIKKKKTEKLKKQLMMNIKRRKVDNGESSGSEQNLTN